MAKLKEDRIRGKGRTVRLTEDMDERLTKIALRLGTTPSALLTLSVGEYVTRKENEVINQEKMIKSYVDSVVNQMKDLLQDPEKLEKIMPVLDNVGEGLEETVIEQLEEKQKET